MMPDFSDLNEFFRQNVVIKHMITKELHTSWLYHLFESRSGRMINSAGSSAIGANIGQPLVVPTENMNPFNSMPGM